MCILSQIISDQNNKIERIIMRIRIFLFALSLFSSYLIHSKTGLSHFCEYTGNVFANSTPLVMAAICALSNNSNSFTQSISIAGTLFFGGIPAYKIVECIQESKNKERYYLFKKSLNNGADIILILTLYVGLCSNHAELSGACLIGYIAKYLICNRPKKEVIAADAP